MKMSIDKKVREVLRRHLLAAWPRGVHAVYSHLNYDVREVGHDPIALTNELQKAGLVTTRPAKGGVVIKLTPAGYDWLAGPDSASSGPASPEPDSDELIDTIVRLVLEQIRQPGKPKIKKAK